MKDFLHFFSLNVDNRYRKWTHNKTMGIQDVVSKNCKGYSSYCCCLRVFFPNVLIKRFNIRGAKTRNATKSTKRQFRYMSIVFGCPGMTHGIMALFSSAYHFTPRSAELILVQADTTKSFAISLTCWIIFIISNIPRNP